MRCPARLIACAEIDEPLLLHVQHTLDRVADIKETFERAVGDGDGAPELEATRERLAAA